MHKIIVSFFVSVLLCLLGYTLGVFIEKLLNWINNPAYVGGFLVFLCIWALVHNCYL